MKSRIIFGILFELEYYSSFCSSVLLFRINHVINLSILNWNQSSIWNWNHSSVFNVFQVALSEFENYKIIKMCIHEF